MSRAPASRSRRQGNLKVAGLSLDIAVFKPWLSQALPSLTLSIIRIGQELVGSVSG